MLTSVWGWFCVPDCLSFDFVAGEAEGVSEREREREQPIACMSAKDPGTWDLRPGTTIAQPIRTHDTIPDT